MTLPFGVWIRMLPVPHKTAHRLFLLGELATAVLATNC